MLGRVFRDILGHIGQKDAIALPDDEMRRVGGIDTIDRVNVARISCPMRWNTRSAPVRSTRRNAGIFGSNALATFFGDRQVVSRLCHLASSCRFNQAG